MIVFVIVILFESSKRPITPGTCPGAALLHGLDVVAVEKGKRTIVRVMIFIRPAVRHFGDAACEVVVRSLRSSVCWSL